MKPAKVGLLIGLAAALPFQAANAQLPYGPDTCSAGYVWREAFPGDHVCVTPGVRSQAASDNAQARARREPGGGPYGPDTCRQGYVWREARRDDHVCVRPETRTQAAADNHFAATRLAANTAVPRPGDASSRTCTIYEHRDYGGAHWTLHNGDDMKMISTPELGTSDGIHRFIYQASWNDKVSSFKVAPGCTLTLWEHVDRGGHYFRSNRSYNYVGDRWNDKASEAVCECTGMSNW